MAVYSLLNNTVSTGYVTKCGYTSN